MVRETNSVCFGQLAQETQVVVREDNKKDHLKRSTEDVSPPNFSERNSGYYERNSRLVSETDSYLKRSNSSSYQSSSNNSSNNNSSLKNPENRSRTRDRLYRNGPNPVAVSSTTGSSAPPLLSEKTTCGAGNKINNSRVPPTSWYEAAATYTNGPGGSGNADVSAAKINHYQTAPSTELQAATTNSATTSSYTAYSFVSSPAYNNSNTTSTTTSSRSSTFYCNVPSAGAVQTHSDKDTETNLSTTPPLLSKKKQKLLKSSTFRSGSVSPTSTTLTGVSGAVLTTMTSSSSVAAPTSSSSSLSSSSNSNNNNSNTINNSRSNQTANNSCSSVSSTINSSNTNNSLSGSSSGITNTNVNNTQSGSSSSVTGILNAAALVAAASKSGHSTTDGHKNSSNSGSVANSSSNTAVSGITSSNNPSASHHSTRSSAHAHFHGRSTTSSSRSHSRSPSSYSSSHSSSSSSSSTASSRSRACSPVGGRDVETSSAANVLSSRSASRSLQSAIAVPGTSSGVNPSGSNLCGSSSSSTSSTSSGTPTGNPVVHSEDNRPLAIRVRNLPARSSDTSLKDGLFHEYKKHGKVTWVKVVGQNAERYALVCFKKPEDVDKALEVSHDKLFFGCKIEVEPYQGYDVEDNEFRPYEAELDEYHPKSTRTLFIGNLEKEITASELRQHFECFGEIIEIDIKKQGMSAYAFCQYSDILSVVKAMRKMDGEHLGNNRIKLGFGKSMPTNCVWIDGIGEKISESHLQSQFLRYGAVSKVVVDRQRQLALVLYEQIQYAQTAVKEMRGATLRGRKLQVDFASRECQDAFYEKLEKQSTGLRFNRYESQSRSRASSFSRHQNSNDGCSPGNTPGSSSSSSAGVILSTPALSSAIVAGSTALSVSNTTSGITLASVVGQATGNTTPARSRGSRSSRHTMDYEYLDTRRFRSCDEYSQGSATSHDEENSSTNHPSSNTNSYSIGLRSDSPLLSRLGPIVNNSGKESSIEMLDMALSRRRCDKSPAKQKGDIRLFQKERAVLLEQLEECPSSGDESIVSPRKRVKIDHHSITSSSCGLTQSHSLDEQQHPQHKNSNCDYLLNDPMHRKSEVRRLSECNNSLNKYLAPQQNHHHSHHAVQPSPHLHHHQQQISRRPSIDFMATSGGVAGGISSMSTRHNSTSSSNSDHHPPPHQSSSLTPSSLACKRRRIIGSGSSTTASASSLVSGSAGGSSNLSSFTNDDCTHHTSRGRGHQLHSHHSHEASGGESADGSRPGTPLCDERPEVLPSEPRRVPRERPREPMVLPLPKFGIQFFQQFRNNVAGGNAISYHHHHHVSGSFTSSSVVLVGSINSGSSSHLLSNSILNRGDVGISGNNSHSSLSHSSTTTSTSAMSIGSSTGSCYLPSPSTRFPPHWRPHNQHHHQQHIGGLHGTSGGATPSSCSSMVSPMRSRSLSSNSSDSDVPGQSSTGSPSLEERIRTLDEMYERWSGGGSSSNAAIGSNVVKRHDFNHTPPTWQHRSSLQSDSNFGINTDVRTNANPSTPSSRHKFLDIDVHEIQPSDIVKSVLAKKSIFDDDLQRLKKNHWYEPSSDSSQLSKATLGVCTSPGLPNFQATKTPVVGCTTSLSSSAAGSSNKTSVTLLQRLTSVSPMNSPQASMSPYNSPSPSSSLIPNSVSLVSTTTMTKVTSVNSYGVPGPQTTTATIATSTSPASAGGTKCLQYPFPTHPPLPNTAAPGQSAQPIPPPPAESSKPSMAQPPLPPMEVLQPPQPPAMSPTFSTTAGTSTKPKTSALSKSLSVPPPPHSTVTTESRILTKSVSLPGSTNLGTVKSTSDSSAVSLTAFTHIEQNQPQQTATGNSSLHPSKSHKEGDLIAKPPIHISSASTSESLDKRNVKSHKHNHRSSDDKKSSKSDKRKNSNASQSHLTQASAVDSSDADENDSKKERKERQERREKELRKQQERDEREREEREREQKEREEKERVEKQRLEKEKLDRERVEKEDRDRLQREKERIRKDEQRAKEERDRKEKEEKERKINEQREREDKEQKEREEAEKLEREERDVLLRNERKEREEHEQKEKLERRMREEKERERKSQEESNNEHKRDINLLKELQRRKENAASQTQTKSGNDMATATSQTAHDFFRQGESDRQNNKENSTAEVSSILDTTSTSTCKHKNRKTSRNTSPVRYPKRRLSSQESNPSNSVASVAYAHTEDHAKRMRIDLPSTANQPQTPINNISSTSNAINDRRDSKDHHGKDRNNKQNRSANLGLKSNIINTSEKEHNTKHHRNKHHHKTQTTSQGVSDTTDVSISKSETEHVMSNCAPKSEDDHHNINQDLELKPKIAPILSSEDEEPSESTSASTPHHNKNVSGHHKHREHGSSHHSRHKSNKREREHHREKKRHSSSTGLSNSSNVNESVPSAPPSVNCNMTDEEVKASSGNQMTHRRISGNNTSFEINTKNKNDVSDTKPSRCSEDGSISHPQTPSHRQNHFNKNTPQSSSKRMVLSSAEDTDGGGGAVGIGLEDDNDSDNRQRSIFDIPDDGPYVSMYDKVKARSCKNMQKQEEEKKIKAKFSQLKQSRAKREEKKRSTSYDGDSDSDFDGGSSDHQKQHNRSGGSYKMLTGSLSSTDDDQNMETCGLTPSRDKRRSSQASSSANSIHPHRLCSDSDDNSVAQRRIKIQDNLRRLCDDGDETSEDDLIRRHNTGFANKRLLHHTSRIASDSESQSQSAVDIKLKQEPLETSNDGANTPVLKHLKHKIKKEVDVINQTGETSDFDEFKFKGLSSMCLSADEQVTASHKIKSETAAELLSSNEIKKELKDYYTDEYLQTDQKFPKSPMISASQHCSSEQTKTKKHKKSKKRQKTPTQDPLGKEQIAADAFVKHSSQANNTDSLPTTNDTKNSKLLTPPCFDAFDELKRGDTLVAHTLPDLQITGERKRHKDRKEKKREKLRLMSADVGSGAELDKIVYEKEKHRLKKSKKSKSVDLTRQTSTTSSAIAVNHQQCIIASGPATCTSQHKQRSGGEKMEDIFGPISDEDDEELTDSDIGGRDLNCIPNRSTSSSNMPGPIVSAALNPYKQEPLTPKSHTVEENEENKQKLSCSNIIGASAHLERVAERQHRKEKREKKRKEREKSRSSEHSQSICAVTATKPMEDENSVDLDAAGRALEAQLMDDSDNKTLEDATPSTANTYRSDMTDVFLFSDCDENSLEMSSTIKHEKKETEKEQTPTISCKNKEKKKKKKRSKEEKQLHHQRRESSSSNASQLATNMVAPSSCSTTKLTIDVQAATKFAQKTSEDHLQGSNLPICKPSPSLPCLVGDDDEDMSRNQNSKSTLNSSLLNVSTTVCTTPHRSSSKDILTLSPHMKDKQMISPIPKTPTIKHTNTSLNTSENLNKKEATTPSTPTSSSIGEVSNANTTPTSSTGASAKSLSKSNESSSGSNVIESPSSSVHTSQQKKKPEIFIPGFDGLIDERISESAVQSISAEFNTPLDSMTNESKIPMESPPDGLKLEKLEESKSRVTISQEETESAVSALLGESFGNSSTDYSFHDDDDGLGDLNNTIADPEPAIALGEPDEEAALAAKAIECEVASSALTESVEDETEEVCKAIQNLRQEDLDVKADTPQSVRDLQIDTDIEENVDEADSSGSHSLKIDETTQSNNSSTTSDKTNTSNQQMEEQIVLNKISKSSVITMVEPPSKTQSITSVTTDSKIEPPTINKQDQPAVQPVQNVLQSVVSTTSLSTTSTVVTSSSMSTYINTNTLTGTAISYTSTPIKTSFVPTSTSSSPTKLTQAISGKPFTSTTTAVTAGYIMQPPTISIPEPTTHFVVPQLVLSPRGVVTSSHHNDASTSSPSMHSPSGHHMPPQSPVAAAYLMGVRAQSPHSPRQHTSRGNTPTPRQASPHTPTPTPPPITVTPQQQQQNILVQRAVQQQQQKITTSPCQVNASQNNSPLTSPIMQQRQIGQCAPINKVAQQQLSPNNGPEQHIIKINNYSTPTSQTMNMVNIRIPPPSQQQHGQQSSPQQGFGKPIIEPQHQQQHVPIGQHILPISVQKMPPVPTHPTIISKVVTVTPQQAQQSMIQQQSGAGAKIFSPPTISNSAAINPSRQSSQIMQQIGGKTIHQQQPQSSQMQFIQQQRQQQHILQIQQQQIIHQQQKLPQQQQTNLISQQQKQQQTQHNFVVSQQRNLASPQQMQHQSQNTQQIKVQYQQQQMLAPSQQSPTQQQNVIQNSTIPQRFLVQQHIVGMSQQQQQQHPSMPQQQQQGNSPQNQFQNLSSQQKLSPIYSGKQQQPQQHQQQQYHHLQQRQQSPSPQRLQHQQSELIKESPRVIISTNQSCQNEQLTLSTATSKGNVEKQCFSPTISMAAGNKQTEGVSVIRTPTPTSSTVGSSTLSQNVTVDTNKESPTSTSMFNTSRSVPLTEENVIKISPPKNDESEQDSKEDSDYWSAKELNVVETNITSKSNASTVSTVIKKNELVCISEIPTLTSTTTSSLPKEQRLEEMKSQTKNNKNDSNSGQTAAKNDIHFVTSSESLQGNVTTGTYSQTGNATTDHDTEDETETQQMPSFEQVPVQGKPSTRGSGAKRGRQPRGGKKAVASNGVNTQINVNVNAEQNQIELGSAVGVQTRLRKPNSGTPATRGRKGRPPRNLLVQQQQLQQKQHEQLIPTPQTSTPAETSSTIPSSTTASIILTTAEKKSRSQAPTATETLSSISENNQQQQHQDVYEFHDESGDESKTSSISTTTSTSAAISEHRPRLILTIKSPAQGTTPLVKASEKTVNIEEPTLKPLVEQTTALQTLENQANKSEPTVTDLATAANTRKSRRLLEKDRSTIDDIIEDVVRNTAPNVSSGNAVANLTATVTNVTNISTSTLPKGAQTPPRRSGRNSSQSKPLKTVEAAPSTAANPIGRPKKPKDRKNVNELEIEQTSSPQSKVLVHDTSDMEDTKSVNIPPTQIEAPVTQTTHSQQQPAQVSTSNSTNHASTAQQQAQQTPQNITATPSSVPQHPKKKALAAAEIESYQTSTTTISSITTPNIHSALPAGGVPMLNTAAPATQKTTGGAADSVNKPLIDPVTGVVSGLQMQQAKEGNLPSATAASQPLRIPMDPKKMIQAAAAAAAVQNISIKGKLQNQSSLTGSIATPITAFMKPVNMEATAAQVAASTVATGMLNKSVSVVVKTSAVPPTPSPPSSIAVQPQQQQSQQQREDVATPTKQPIIMQQQTNSVMHAQHINVRPPTSLKAHVLNSQKLQQQQQHQQQQQQNNQQQYSKQNQSHQILQQQPATNQTVGLPQSSSHVIHNTVVQRQPSAMTTANSTNQQQQQLNQTTKQLLVNIPPPTTHLSHASANALNSPRHLPQHSQQQQQPQSLSSQHSLVIKQAHDMHTPQVLHVVSSKTSAPSLGPNKSAQSSISAVHQQQPNASSHPTYTSYIQSPTGAHSKQQLPQQPVVIHQQTLGVQSKTTTTPLVMPPGLLGLPPHPAMVIQTKTSAPAQSPSAGTSATTTAHLQHTTQHTPSPPLQQQPPQHLVKSLNSAMIHSIQSQGVPHNLNTVASPSSPSAVKPNALQSSVTSNVGGASSLRTAIPTISPQSQARIGSILLPGGMQVPPHFETSMHDIATYGSAVTGSVRTTQSPPPAHQQASPITPSEASFPGGMGRVGVPSREHLMIYQQLLRQHDSLNPANMREFDEKLLGSSPPLELRRPGSVPRTVAVPHSLQSPQDRSTDSPQVAQVYVHNTRIPPHNHFDVTGRPAVAAQPSGYYDATRQLPLEPPPAHRSAAVHSAVAPPSVVVAHPTAGSNSPFMPAVPSSPAVQAPPSSVPHHSKILEREREQREREREQQLLREKEQILIRAGTDAHSMQVTTPPSHQQPSATHQLPPHSQQPPPPQADSLLTLLQRYPVMWQGLLALKTDQAAVQMHFVFGNPHVARASLPCNSDGSTPPLRIAQRMRLEQTQLEGVAKKMQFENEHCMLLALPCGRDHADVLQQSRNLQSGFITYLQQKMAAGIVNIPMPGSEQAAYVVHIFPSCDFANENLEKAAPDLKNRVADIAHLLIVIATV